MCPLYLTSHEKIIQAHRRKQEQETTQPHLIHLLSQLIWTHTSVVKVEMVGDATIDPHIYTR